MRKIPLQIFCGGIFIGFATFTRGRKGKTKVFVKKNKIGKEG